MTLPRGLYDQLLTTELKQRIAGETPSVAVDTLSRSDSILHLVDLVGRTLADSLESLPGSLSEQVESNAALISEILKVIQRYSRSADGVPGLPPPPLKRLRAVGDANIGAVLPETGLAVPWLFTASKGSPTLYEEIRREAASCDSIDILVSFITVSGVRKLMDVLQRVTAADATGRGRTSIRVLTTTYTGATEQRALDTLARLNGCEVRVSLDGRRTRLHAKAWMFKRKTGFGTAYVGSANLSGAALLGGLEWTVKLTERGQDFLFKRAAAHFETLWEDDEFSPYHPDIPQATEALRQALKREAVGSGAASTFFFDITAKPYQADMLQQLQYERDHGRTKNLLVAATGTGKTVMAALDYRRSVAQMGSRPRLLFVSHRQEILAQAMATYRAVLRDGGFGDLLAAGSSPAQYDHLFATIQSVSAQDIVRRFGTGNWHTVVVDECHRLAAKQFEQFAQAIRPTVFLGLTATPERSDGEPLAPFFHMRPDGSPAAELRLWHALDLQLLAPFEYFGCNDQTDFSNVPWGQDGQKQAIDGLVTGNQVRARMIVNEWERLSGNAAGSRALIFCNSLEHARFMTDYLKRAGLPVVMLSGDSSDEERALAPGRLERGEICGIVTVDLYNEGIDIPCVDTLLFLRPTQSPLVFQQQLGRGLRLSDGKASCLVLDFVGRHRAEFRFDRLLASITGLTRKGILRGVQEGFSTLPSGCHIHLEAQATAQILSSLRGIAANSWRNLKRELMAFSATRPAGGVRLGRFLDEYEVELRDVYRDAARSGWTPLRRDAGVLSANDEPADEAKLSRALRMLLHNDDPEHLALIGRVAESKGEYEVDSARSARRLQMLAYQLDHTSTGSYQELLVPLCSSTAVLDELGQLTEILAARSRVGAVRIPGFEDLPLLLHARYSRREILAGVGYHSATSRPSVREGVLNLPDAKLQLLFVTLDKSDGFHDRIAYHDYAVSVSRFHWQTQNSAGPRTETGRRYLESQENGWRFLLFVRETPEHAFFSCGTARLVSEADVSGEKPMNIVWTLDTQLPVHAFRAFCAIRGV
ncbi:MAG: DUF3427 domain-containing protein [Gemmatimonadaceae bacterium]|nr:DUF3427 domain-containing protein [Gemmatimonadaceae bacterium]